MLRFLWWITVLMVLGLPACGGSGEERGGGTVDSDEALHGLMHAIALDFAQVLADVAPQYSAAAMTEGGKSLCAWSGGSGCAPSPF